jgi:hypothetical protein
MNMAQLVIAGATLYGSQPVMWSIATEILLGKVTGSVSGTINAVGVVGASAGPYLVGYARAITHSFSGGLPVMGGSLIGTCVLVSLIRGSGGPREPAVLFTPGARRPAEWSRRIVSPDWAHRPAPGSRSRCHGGTGPPRSDRSTGAFSCRSRRRAAQSGTSPTWFACRR